ncbi:hypothetical protein [Mycolicibacterium mageritense]|uniref:hypothetical protein n=1 Tax=Mycolicibacterium mageritense TaxID=53462 RepID=UPI00093E6518|nr:hypothetical protein [Mycolicibacterium mageritense]OKH65408.1 hypothetical protein EB73_21960 [Mycobacterium sp. SWH-M3]TXI56234.1 MAG: hypothetical protein E6Q55_29570 [Mycolicibacterium mageritense]
MIYHDRARLVVAADSIDLTVGAEVFPLSTSDVLVLDGAANVVTSKYRMVLAPDPGIAAIRTAVGSDLRIGWGAWPLSPTPQFNEGLRLDGEIERHTVRGRLHHYEIIARRTVS